MKEYYKLCLFSPLWLPVVLGIVAVCLEALIGNAYDIFPGWISGFALTVIASFFYGGVQYGIALVIVWSRIDFERTGSWVVGVLWLPIIFTLIQTATMLPFMWPNLLSGRGPDGLGVIALLDLALGYGYVLVWLLGLALIRVFYKSRKVVVV